MAWRDGGGGDDERSDAAEGSNPRGRSRWGGVDVSGWVARGCDVASFGLCSRKAFDAEFQNYSTCSTHVHARLGNGLNLGIRTRTFSPSLSTPVLSSSLVISSPPHTVRLVPALSAPPFLVACKPAWSTARTHAAASISDPSHAIPASFRAAGAYLLRTHALPSITSRTRTNSLPSATLNDTPAHARWTGRRPPDALSAKEQACELDVHVMLSSPLLPCRHKRVYARRHTIRRQLARTRRICVHKGRGVLAQRVHCDSTTPRVFRLNSAPTSVYPRVQRHTTGPPPPADLYFSSYCTEDTDARRHAVCVGHDLHPTSATRPACTCRHSRGAAATAERAPQRRPAPDVGVQTVSSAPKSSKKNPTHVVIPKRVVIIIHPDGYPARCACVSTTGRSMRACCVSDGMQIQISGERHRAHGLEMHSESTACSAMKHGAYLSTQVFVALPATGDIDGAQAQDDRDVSTARTGASRNHRRERRPACDASRRPCASTP